MISYNKRCFIDPLMLSNVFYLIPSLLWYYLEFYYYCLYFLCVFASSYIYHRSKETKYLYIDMFFGSGGFLLSIYDNLTYNNHIFWVAILSSIVYYFVMWKTCYGKCTRYKIWHSIWHAWTSMSLCVGVYAYNKHLEI